MQAKQSKSATEDQKLTSIEKQLIECAKSKKPVLFHGEDTIGYHDLVLRTYTEALIEQGIKGINGIVNFELEYFDSKGKSVSIQELKGVHGSRHKDEVLKRIIGHFTNCDSESTVRTRKIIDCTGMNGKEVYAELVELPAIEDKEFGLYKKKEKLKTIDDYDYEQQQNKGYLFQCKGLLILDNLQINPGNSEDITYYIKLGKIIRDKEKGIEHFTVNWLVAYTQNPDDFPPDFRKQFEEINLEPGLEKKPAVPRGKKVNYVNKDDFEKFLNETIDAHKSESYGKIAKIVIGKKEKRFIKDNGSPFYKETTIKRQIAELCNLKSNRKVSVK